MTGATGSLLVVAGEASGDRAAAAVLAKLAGGATEVHAFGMGGGAMMREGVDVVAHLEDTTALGVGEVARRASNVALAWAKIRREVKRRKPTAALLVNYTEFNTRLARALWPLDVRVLWYGAPQVWAWRPNRAEALRRHVDRMAVMLPFEEALWRARGVDAHYVGHPALEERDARVRDPAEARVVARELVGMTPRASSVAILAGSRPHEVRRLLQPMLEGYEVVRRDLASVDARVLLAPSLDRLTRNWATAVAKAADVAVVEVDARAGIAAALPAFDVALCASGTASLECALARAVPIVCYRVGLAAEPIARLLLETPHVALPNVLLGRRAFPELLQRQVTRDRIAEELGRAIEERPAMLASCDAVEQVLGHRTHASSEVARMLAPWL